MENIQCSKCRRNDEMVMGRSKKRYDKFLLERIWPDRVKN